MINTREDIFKEIAKATKTKPEDCFWLIHQIAKFIGKGNRCWPSNPTLEKLTGWGNKKLLKVKNELYKLGLLSCEFKREGSKNKNIYTVNKEFITKFNGVPMSNGHTSIQPMSIQPMSNGHTYYLVPMSNGHTLIKVPMSIQPTSIQPTSNGHTEVLDIIEVLSNYKVLKSRSSDADAITSQNSSLKLKIEQLQKENKELAERLNKQSFKVVAASTKQKESTKSVEVEGVPFYSEYVHIVSQLNQLAGKGCIIYKKQSQILKDGKYKEIVARLRQGATSEQMVNVIRVKSEEWKGEDRTKVWLRTSTLFGEKFQKYLDDVRNDNLSRSSQIKPIKSAYSIPGKTEEEVDDMIFAFYQNETSKNQTAAS